MHNIYDPCLQLNLQVLFCGILVTIFESFVIYIRKQQTEARAKTFERNLYCDWDINQAFVYYLCCPYIRCADVILHALWDLIPQYFIGFLRVVWSKHLAH